MSSPHQHPAPASLRYLKARLKPFIRPSFLASSFVLVLMLFFAWDIWQDPKKSFHSVRADLVSSFRKLISDPELSSDELAARLIDIDNSSVLLEEVNPEDASALPNQKDKTADAKDTGGSKNLRELFPPSTLEQAKFGLEEESTDPTKKSQQQPNANNPFAISTPELSNSNPLLGESSLTNQNRVLEKSSSSTAAATPQPTSGFNLFNPPENNQSPLSVNPSLNSLPQVNAVNPHSLPSASPAPITTNNFLAPNQNNNLGALPISPLPNTPSIVTPINPSTPSIAAPTPVNSGNQASQNSSSQGNINSEPRTAAGVTGFNRGYNQGSALPRNTAGGVTGNNTFRTTSTASPNPSNSLVPQPITGSVGTTRVTPIVPSRGNFGSSSFQSAGQTRGFIAPPVRSTGVIQPPAQTNGNQLSTQIGGNQSSDQNSRTNNPNSYSGPRLGNIGRQ